MLSIDFLPTYGGIAAHIYELSKALVKQGNEVHVITLRRDFREKKYQEIDGLKVHKIYYPRLKAIGFFVYFFLVRFKLKELSKNGEMGVIHAHTSPFDAMISSTFKGIPRVETEHSSGFLEDRERGKHKWLYRWLLNQADHVIGPSQELVDTFVKLGVEREKTSFISNGVDIEKFNPQIRGDEVRKKYGIEPDEKLILCPRRLDPKNGVKYLIKAMPHIVSNVNNVRCLIVGDGVEMEDLKREVVKLGVADKVIFAGRVPNSEMPKYYAASDVVVLPSLIEATSIAGLEAMATGKTIVGTSVGGIPQIIAEGETGILVPPINPEELAYAIVSLLNNNRKCDLMGLNARKKAEMDFSWQIIARQTQDLYQRVVQSRRKTNAQV